MASLAVEATIRSVEMVFSLILQKINQKKDVKEDIDSIMRASETIRAFLNDEGATRGNQRHEDKVRQIRGFGFDFQDALDKFMLNVPHQVHTHKIKKFAHEVFLSPSQKAALSELSRKIDRIRFQIQKFIELNQLCAGNTSSGEGGSSGLGSEDHLVHGLIEEDDIVGFEDHVKSICDQLLSGKPRRISTMSIVGPPGSGKTVLAQQVFECKRVRNHFGVRAWVRVSRSFKLEELLRSIWTQFFPGKDQSFFINGPLVKETFKKHLQQKRFIVVLDDIWRMQDLRLIANALRIGSSRSRILVTSCHSDVGIFCPKYPNYVHELNGLPLKKASRLLRKKAFCTCNGICPPELKYWSEKIVKKCEGLPSAVTAAGNLLSSKRPIPREWKNLHDTLGACVMGSILMPRYQDLPGDLRNCFLYFSIFPEDYSIKRQRLICPWIAEGFVKEERNKSLEEVAEDCLNELVQRNLVHVTARDIDGRVRTCRVLTVVHDFIIAKAEEENFVGFASKRNSLSHGRIRRLSARTDICTNKLSETLGHVRSAFMFGREKFSNLEFFPLLKILDMQGAPLEEFPIDIVKLVLLKYLSLRETNIKTVPKSIEKLSYLETLDLKKTGVTQLPGSIYRLHLLRHLLVYRYDVRKYVTYDGAKGVEMHSGKGPLADMQKLSLVKATTELIEKLDGMIHLRKLGLANLKSKDGRKLCESIQNMEHLLTLDLRADSGDYLKLDHIQIKPGFEFLRRLYLEGQLQKLPKWVSSLQSLIKVGLKWSRLNINQLQALQDLPNLMELHMVNAFTGQILELKVNTFKKLKVLWIEQFSELRLVVMQDNAMPALEKLTFCKCEKLNMSSLGIDVLPGLQELLLYDMNKEFISELQKKVKIKISSSHIRVIHS